MLASSFLSCVGCFRDVHSFGAKLSTGIRRQESWQCTRTCVVTVPEVKGKEKPVSPRVGRTRLLANLQSDLYTKQSKGRPFTK